VHNRVLYRVMEDALEYAAERRDDLVIYDVAPTILTLFGLPPVADMRGSARALAREAERA